MASVAIIGQDGAGKTTIANMVLEKLPYKMKYIYMGRNVDSSNYFLPTSKFIHLYKIYKYKKKHKIRDSDAAKKLSLHEIDQDRKKDTRGKIGAFLRLLNRLAEEWYRLLISLSYQKRGFLVVYDRHFLVDSIPDKLDTEISRNRLTTRIHDWILKNLYETPSIIFFLYAPAEVLFARKGEATIDYIKAKNEAFLKFGENLKGFEVIDATQQVDKVFEDVKGKIDKLYISQKRNKFVIKNRNNDLAPN
jgi:thymidylate kinase